MKEEIKKKIEAQADILYPCVQLQSLSAPHAYTLEGLAFIKGAEFMHSLAQQSVNSELYSEIERLIISWNIDAHSTAGTLTRQIISVISASQNQQNEKAIDVNEFTKWFTDTLSEEEKNEFIQQNEKSAPSQVVEEAMKATQKDVRVPNAIRTGEVSLPQQNEKESDSVEFSRFVLSIEGTDLMNEGKSMEMIYELFKQSKTNPHKDK